MFGLFYPLATIVVVYLIKRYLEFELKRAASFTQHINWIVWALVLQVSAVVVSSLLDSHIGNFIQHGLGGGVVMTLLFVYFVKTFEIRANWRILSLVLFGFVCAFGVINELAEFAGSLLGVGVFSFDSHDTWRDLFANTTGMVVAWLIILATYTSKKKTLTS